LSDTVTYFRYAVVVRYTMHDDHEKEKYVALVGRWAAGPPRSGRPEPRREDGPSSNTRTSFLRAVSGQNKNPNYKWDFFNIF
jgi:hypothetical protein